MKWRFLASAKSRDTLKVNLVTAVFTLLAAFGSVGLQAWFTSSQAARTEERGVRRATYLDFEEKANTYDYTTQDFKRCVLALTNEKKLNSDDLAKLATLGMANCSGQNLVSARSDFQGSINQMYLDGTREAIDLARKIAGTLPLSLGTTADIHGLPPMVEILNTSDADFNSLFVQFEDRTCLDVRATDLQVCKEP
jgi:hypothetical protein